MNFDIPPNTFWASNISRLSSWLAEKEIVEEPSLLIFGLPILIDF